MFGTISLLAQATEKIDTPDVAWSTLVPLLIVLGGAIVFMVVACHTPA